MLLRRVSLFGLPYLTPGDPLGTLWGPLGDPWGTPWGSQGPLGDPLDPWVVLGTPWDPLGTLWASIGDLRVRLGVPWRDHVNLLGITWEFFWTLWVPLRDFLGATWNSKGLSKATKGVPGDHLGASWEHFARFESVHEANRCNMQKPSNLLEGIAKIEVWGERNL